jgi:hypothetical protein
VSLRVLSNGRHLVDISILLIVAVRFILYSYQ